MFGSDSSPSLAIYLCFKHQAVSGQLVRYITIRYVTLFSLLLMICITNNAHSTSCRVLQGPVRSQRATHPRIPQLDRRRVRQRAAPPSA